MPTIEDSEIARIVAGDVDRIADQRKRKGNVCTNLIEKTGTARRMAKLSSREVAHFLVGEDPEVINATLQSIEEPKRGEVEQRLRSIRDNLSLVISAPSVI